MISTISELDKIQGSWTIDPAHTRIGFSVRHAMVTTVRGSFASFRGDIAIADTKSVRVEVEIETSSVNTGQTGRDDHLRSPDFFDSPSYPHIRFISTGIEEINGDDFVLVGDLTIKDVTRQVRIKVESTGVQVDHRGSIRAGFEGSTTILRSDFGLTWNAQLEAGGVLVSDKIKIELDLSAVKNT